MEIPPTTSLKKQIPSSKELKTPYLRDGFVDERKAHRISFSWILRQPKKAVAIFTRQPRKAFRYILRHPGKFLVGKGKKANGCDRCDALAVFAAEQLPALSVFAAEQLPALLSTVAELNHRQLSSDDANLVKSVPIALRRLTRDMVAAQEELVALRSELEVTVGSTGYLMGRVEFVRREVMFEMRYGAGNDPSKMLDAQTEILAADKVAAARAEGARINLGCGHIPLDGYLNVDRRALTGVDIVAEVHKLPFEKDELAEVFSSHLLEHFPHEQLRRELLPYYFTLLRPGGKFTAVVPDAEAMIREYTAGNYPYKDMRDVVYGGQDYDGDFHFNMFTPESMTEYFVEAGFTNVLLVAGGRRNGQCYELEITGEKPQTTTTTTN
jgi:predicted SAM-dependent methyltransferase